jgi:hypothetical protein
MKRSKPRFAQLGSVSSGTMRPEDLIPAFLDVADGLRLSKADRAEADQIRKRYEHASEADPGGQDVEDAGTEDGSDYWTGDGATCADEDMTVLFDLLERYAPPYAYFGAHEGDGADYGFWPSMESLEDAVREGEVWASEHCPDPRHATPCRRDCFACEDCSKVACPESAHYYRVVSDHGNVSLYYRNGREVWGIV